MSCDEILVRGRVCIEDGEENAAVEASRLKKARKVVVVFIMVGLVLLFCCSVEFVRLYCFVLV